MNTAKLHFRLISLLSQYDEKRSKKQGYNLYALPQYMQAADKWLELTTKGGHSPLEALYKSFTHHETVFCLAPIRKFVKELNALALKN